MNRASHTKFWCQKWDRVRGKVTKVDYLLLLVLISALNIKTTRTGVEEENKEKELHEDHNNDYSAVSLCHSLTIVIRENSLTTVVAQVQRSP